MERSPRVLLTIAAALQLPLQLLLLLLLLLSPSCSDSANQPLDARADKKTVRDQPQADVTDSAADVANDRGRVEATVSNARRDGVKDGAKKPDGAKDTGPTDIGNPLFYGTVTRTVTPIGDAKGQLYIGLYLIGIPFPLVSTQLTADLSAPGAKVPYAFYSTPAPGGYALFAFLDDNGNAAPPFVVPDAGDLVMSSSINVTLGSTPQKIDLVLDKVEGSIGDGGASVGALKGRVTATVAPSGDGKGTLYISLHDQVPPAGQVASTSVNNADLSSPYASETYFLSALKPGNYYLAAFLDDNSNNNPFAPGPDKGDMVPAKLIQVHVVAGVQNQQDVVLDKLQP